MTEILNTIVSQFQQNSLLELTAVVFAVAYLLLAVKENVLCWSAALVSTAIFLFIFWQVKLYMESGLQIYYIVMACYGWYQWTRAGPNEGALTVSSWSLQNHVIAVLVILTATFFSGYILDTGSDARLPFLDSFTTWASIVTTYMVAKKILENWIYWLVIDSVSIYLYLDRELYFTSMLFVVYIIIIFFGWFSWLKSYRQISVNA
ncbi:MAG TPA: nicotinamide riboside transporter PnuC [Pseudomonadales bacterium]|nr:nicotinamide mononucleotide transporter [Gammaproteobacteria bacterium]MDP6025258.1 nicotinamide riboside transporter PnuC [Pseudomonadales bacterium]MDP6315299.1 nicotinamide riboside transporter PnuC [Pseudomonadales bacterium]MDP7314747.1 nicotinamide riboside transporter PnuC [Pseudomonadales bacterium]HJL60373.1 nicotinamide riboside transporter PnuC [Pseudomonadales bacterium]|tara:strand:- start:1192 stop:1806 length:615 start_codon:yes stop_codon:yes gene_type:complete